MQKTVRNILLGGAMVVAAALLFCFPQAVLTGASRGLSLCGSVLIPSLLPFLTLVGVCVRCGVSEALGNVLRRPIALLFKLPPVAATPLLFSFLGGYPTGALMVKQLLDDKKITVQQAARMMHICVGAGPAFVVGAVGGVMLGNSRLGWILLAAHVLSAWIIGVVEGLRAPLIMGAPMTTAPMPLATAFTQAVHTATEGLVAMSGFVILFSVGLSLADGSGFTAWLDAYLSGGTVMLAGLLEVTAGCMAASGEPLLFLMGFFLSFGGLSVQCQVRTILQTYPTALKDFFLFRVLHGLLGGGLTVLLCAVFPSVTTTLTSGTAVVQAYMVSPLVSVVFLGMGVALLLSGKKRLPKGE